MNEETKKIVELTERLIKIEEPLPEVFSSTDPAEILRYLQSAREPIELLRNLREQLAKMNTAIKVFNRTVKIKLIEIKEKATLTDRIKSHLRFVHLLTVLSDEELESIGGKLPEKFNRVRQDSQLRIELNGFFEPLYDPTSADYLEDIYGHIFGVGSDDPEAFKFEVSDAAHRSTFKPAEYLGWAREVMDIVDPEQYGERGQSVGTPIVSQTVPPALDRHLQRLKTCYLLGLDEMTIVSCRSVLEAALFKVLCQRGKLQGGGNVDDEFYPLAKLLGLTDHQMLGSEMKDRAHRIRLLAKDILHNKGTSEVNEKIADITPLKELALASVKDTFDIVEALYG